MANLFRRGIMRGFSMREVDRLDAGWLLRLLEAQDIIAETANAKQQMGLAAEGEPTGWGDA